MLAGKALFDGFSKKNQLVNIIMVLGSPTSADLNALAPKEAANIWYVTSSSSNIEYWLSSAFR